MSVRNQFIAAEAVDARWFLALKAIKRPLILRSLGIDSALLAQEKEKVFGAESYNPTFIYPRLQADQVRTALDQLLKLRALVCQEEGDSSIRTLYAERMSELILEQELLLATALGDGEHFTAVNYQLYGEVHPSYVAEHVRVLQSRYHIFEGCTVSETESTILPTPADFALAKTILRGPDIIATETEYQSDTLVAAWNAELEKTIPNWKVIIDPIVVHMLVDHKRRVVRIPTDVRMQAKKMRKSLALRFETSSIVLLLHEAHYWLQNSTVFSNFCFVFAHHKY